MSMQMGGNMHLAFKALIGEVNSFLGAKLSPDPGETSPLTSLVRRRRWIRLRRKKVFFPPATSSDPVMS